MPASAHSQASSPAPATAARVWFITGCSTGLGRSLARAVLARGERVVATARRVETLDDLAAGAGAAPAPAPGQCLTLPLDVTDAGQIKAAVDAAIARFGGIDVLVNNAGFGMIGAVEEVSDAEARRLFDTNFFGLLSVTRAVLPHFRARRAGHILNMSSQGGLLSFPGSGLYCASKFALEAVSESLAAELKPLGIKVTLIEPGPFRTDFLGRSIAVAAPIADYADSAGKRRADLPKLDGQQPGDPEKAAAAMIQMVDLAEPPLRLALGSAMLKNVRGKLAAVAKDLDAWEAVTAGADFR